LLLCHGVGDNDMIRLQPGDVGYALESNLELTALIDAGVHRLVVGGHTHRVMVRRFGGLTVVNPGTLLRSADPRTR
jgi:predicted phosphodiesterase